MATMIGLFSSIGEHIPIFRKDKIVEASAEGTINRSRPRSRFRSRSKVTLILKIDMQLSNSHQYDLNLIYVTMKKITLFLIL